MKNQIIRRKWTDAERQKLRAMRADGATYKEMARALGKSRRGVANQISRLGLCGQRRPPRVWTPADLAAVDKMTKQGVRDKVIAAEFDVSADCIGSVRQAYNLTRKRYPKEWDKKTIRAMFEMRRMGATWEHVAAACGRSIRAVQAKYYKEGGGVRPQPAWHKGDVVRLFEMKRRHITWPHIAADLGRTPSAVAAKYYKERARYGAVG